MKKIISFCMLCLFLFNACKKEEGQGGTSTITGKLYASDYNSAVFTGLPATIKDEDLHLYLTDSFYLANEDVFIIYGDDSIYSDKFKTNYDGSFTFKYLRKGKYTIYALSKDLKNRTAEPLIPVKQTVEITQRKQELFINDIKIIK